MLVSGGLAAGQIADPASEMPATSGPIEDAGTGSEETKAGTVIDPESGSMEVAAASSPTGSGTSNFEGFPGLSGTGGLMSFKTDLFSGSFNYSVPIQVPPARQGAEPSLALGYNSSGGNGWCGLGWSLGVGSIQRDTREGVPRAHGVNNWLSRYDDTKGFVASIGGKSMRLVPVGNGEYRPDIEDGSFLRFHLDSGANKWAITDKSGNLFYFGQSSSSRMEHPLWSGGASRTFHWALDRIVDVNGNETQISYVKDSGQLYLRQIGYNGHSSGMAPVNFVDFVLESRDDKTSSYRSGYRVETAKRLKEIVTSAQGQRAHRYELVYLYSETTFRSTLRQVRQFGKTNADGLPAIELGYARQAPSFGPLIDWNGIKGELDTLHWRAPRAYTTTSDGSLTDVDLIDMDADGLPDRVIRGRSGAFDRFYVQRNQGVGLDGNGSFAAPAALPEWSAVDTQNLNSARLGAMRSSTSAGVTTIDMFDINRDGLVDRIAQPYSSTQDHFRVQLNRGLPDSATETGWAPQTAWRTVSSEIEKSVWLSIRATQDDGRVDITDMNGDGLPDRVMTPANTTFDHFKVQLNTGSGFAPIIDWGGVGGGGYPNGRWNFIYGMNDLGNGDSATFAVLQDINGDGLPDRVLRKLEQPFASFSVQFNNGSGFEPPVAWSALASQGTGTAAWGSVGAAESSGTAVALLDLNGDGLPDRVTREKNTLVTKFIVQMNTGNGFAAEMDWLGVSASSADKNFRSISSVDAADGTGRCDMIDMDGDGLIDRVMRRENAPYNRFKVQLNQGPYPDLLVSVRNGMGGAVAVGYQPSTLHQNRDRDFTEDPWAARARSLLPFPLQTVSKVTVDDGMGNADTSTYAYEGGYYDFRELEFRGFNCVASVDPAGTITRTYFHQGGGRDDSANGEWQDAFGKQGTPYLVEVEGSNAQIYKRTLNKVETISVDGGLAIFPQLKQTVEMEYEGQTSYRATAKRFTYDPTTGNLTREDNFGEVSGVSLSAHTFTDVQPAGQSDSLATAFTYASLANTAIKSRPERILVYDGAAAKLKERWLEYDAKGNLRFEHLWLDDGNRYITREIQYDSYGNPVTVINPVGIASTTVYDPATRTFPVSQTVGSFTTTSTFDLRSGQTLSSTDPKGLVAESQYDGLFRLKKRLISTAPNATPSLVLEQYEYGLFGILHGETGNYIRKQIYEPADTAEGWVNAWTYTDGLGRAIQSRTESEQSGQYRVADTVYDGRGNAEFETLPYLSAGRSFTAFNPSRPGTTTDFDAVGRAWRVNPPVGDTDSPTAPVTTAYRDGTDPWAIVATDSLGKVRKSYHDAYGRVTRIVENNDGPLYTTAFAYSPTGDLTRVTDHAGNQTVIHYDSLGRKADMTDPDMGTWIYAYDDAGRLFRQTDAKGQKIEFEYLDALGRMTAKRVYNAAAALARTSTYYYDSNGGDTAYSVYPGQLFKVVDSEGWQKTSYDFRGRVLSTTRHLNYTNTDYATSSTYDAVDRPLEVTYPGAKLVKLKNTYGSVGQLTKVESLAGTGANETFYTAPQFNPVGQLTQFSYGNGLTTNYDYFANSKRLQTLRTSKPGGGYHQNLTYTYDETSNIKSIADGIYTGNAAASLSAITYDGLHRLTGFSRAGNPVAFTYDPLGNMQTNGENGGAAYTYGGSRPHAVTSALGKTYAYDANGNMTARGPQGLEYDEENRLTRVLQTSGNVVFAYAADGTRLYRYGASGTTLWIGGLYEEKNGAVLCHVFADGKRIATFEPQSALAGFIGNNQTLAQAKNWLTQAADWPFQEGRTPFLAMLLPLLGILAFSMFMRRRDPVTTASRPPPRSGSFSLSTINYQLSTRPAHGFITTLLIVALTLATTPTRVQAATYAPVFYYYSPDHLGSSSVMTDRAGDLVQHYEYGAYGHERYVDNSSAFNASNRYTGQVLDEDTGLYYYNARYYDPELGRFTQPDTIVPEPSNPQALNRYSYVANNPLKYIDPSGNFLEWVAVAVGAIIGAIIGAVTTGTVKGALLGALTGAIAAAAVIGGAAIGGVIASGYGAAAGSAGVAVGTAIGTVAGGALGGAINAAITGGNVGMGALTGAVSSAIGWGVGQGFSQLATGVGAGAGSLSGNAISAAGRAAGGAIAGGVAAEISRGTFAEGAVYGAAGAVAGFIVGNAITSPSLHRIFWKGVSITLDVAGKVWNSPNTAVGLIFGLAAVPFGAKSGGFGSNALQFENHPWMPTAITLGNVISYGGKATDPAFNPALGQDFGTLAQHEAPHTYQGQQLGPLYILSNALGMAVSQLTDGNTHGRNNWNERGPQSVPARTWNTSSTYPF